MRKKNQSSEETKVDDSWLLPYADMLTLLLALFIILFAMSEVDAQKYSELAQFFKSEFSSGKQGMLENDPTEVPVKKQEEADDEYIDNAEKSQGIQELYQLTTLKNKVNDYISKNNLSHVLGTMLTDEGLLITILNDISFDSGSAKVKKEGITIAKEMASFLYTDPPHQIVISGHADDVPMNNDEFSSNWELSVMRAVNFMGVLLENDNLDPECFSAKGFGEHQPIVPNTSVENRAKNRRVEVLILPNYEIHTTGEDTDDS